MLIGRRDIVLYVLWLLPWICKAQVEIQLYDTTIVFPDSCFRQAHRLYNQYCGEFPIDPYKNIILLADYSIQDSLIEIKMNASISEDEILHRYPSGYYLDESNQTITYIFNKDFPMPKDTIWLNNIVQKTAVVLKQEFTVDWKHNRVRRMAVETICLFDPIPVNFLFRKGKMIKRQILYD